MYLSYTLVFLQFLFFGLLFWPTQSEAFGGAWILSMLLSHLALILLVWIMIHNRFGNYNIIPEIKEGARLIKTGPYAYIRHPMYSAVLLLAMAFLLFWFHPYKILVLMALSLTLYSKAKKEERLWLQSLNEYSEYKKATGMFLPRLFKR